jgi:hypothetical protein
VTRWRKLGRVYVADGQRPWAASHAYVPTTVRLREDRIRVYCAFRDGEGIGRVGYVDVDAEDPTRVVAVSERPVLDIGAPGRFDDNGVTPLSIVALDDGTLRLYYAGWQLGVRVRYFLFTGLAESRDGGETFQRVSQVPVLDRSDGEASTRTGGTVLPAPGGGWRMWYAGGSDWVAGDDVRPERPSYALRYAESRDGVSWPAAGTVCLEPADGEHGFGRPAVLVDGDRLRMWYSRRLLDVGYRIGYAESRDGREWVRMDDQAGIDVSATGWDSTMQSMASIEQTPAGTYLFYNGNDYGATGFGVAIAQDA